MSTNIGFTTLKTTVASVAFAVAAVSSSLADAAHITPKAAFANSKFENERGPQYAINGTGMDEATGTHGIDAKGYMWMGKGSGNVNNASFAKWFVVDLGKVYSLDKMKIWNFNMNNGQSYANRGLKQIDIYVSTKDEDFSGSPTFSDTSTWTLFKENHSVSKATGAADYKGDTPVEFNGTAARWVGFWIDSLHDNSLEDGHTGGYGGLSEVRFWELKTPGVSLSGVPAVSSSTTATLSGEVFNTEGTARNVCVVYGTAAEGDDPSAWTGSTAEASRGDGAFSVTVTELASGTEYRAAFRMAVGNDTYAYSVPVFFTTSAIGIETPGDIYESDPSAKSIVFTRSSTASTLPLTISYSLGGTAVAGTDYAEVSGTATFAAGQTTATVAFTPIDNEEDDGERTVVVTVLPGAYVSGAEASFSILNDEGAGAECVWTGSGDGENWGDPLNWGGSRVPSVIDTATFTDSGLAAGGTVTIDSDASCAVLKISRLGAMTLGGDGSLTLGGIARVDLDGSEGDHTISAKLIVFGSEGVTNGWSLGGTGDFYVSGDVGVASSGVVIRKTGTARLRFGKNDMSYTGSWHIAEGNVYVDGSNRMRGALTIGGEDANAQVTFSNNTCFHGNVAVTVLANGRLDASQGMNDSRISVLNVYDGGYARVGYFYLGAYTLRGGTIEGTAWSDLISNWPEYITTYESETTSVVNVSYSINWWNPFTITVADGAAPVDLVAKSFSGGNADGTSNGDFAKKGPGVIKVTGNCSAERSLKINEGTWLADNETSGCSRANVTVAAGATLGGIGSVLGSHYPDAQTVTVNGASGKLGCLMPGSIDNETGDHIYGTLTIGSAAVTNHVGMGSYTCAKIGVGPKNATTKTSPVDKLKVYGSLVIGENCTLDLTTNSAELEDIKGGTFTIVEADAISGEFKTVEKPKPSWKVEYVSEEVEGTPVVKRIVLTVPEKGFMISVR